MSSPRDSLRRSSIWRESYQVLPLLSTRKTPPLARLALTKFGLTMKRLAGSPAATPLLRRPRSVKRLTAKARAFALLGLRLLVNVVLAKLLEPYTVLHAGRPGNAVGPQLVA